VSRAVREREMVAAARRIFTERGFAATSMDDIATAARISKPMLYAYFGSKEGLFAECVREAGIDFRASVRAAAGDPGDLPPDRRLWAGLLAVFDGIERDRDAWDLLYPLEGQGPSGALGARGNYGLHAMTELVEGLLADAARAGGLSEDFVAQTPPIARALAGAVLGLVDWWRRHPDEPKEVHALRAMNFAWRGLEQLLAGDLWLPPEMGG
jgi:AcrR family transcriptional regulator